MIQISVQKNKLVLLHHFSSFITILLAIFVRLSNMNTIIKLISIENVKKEQRVIFQERVKLFFVKNLKLF